MVAMSLAVFQALLIRHARLKVVWISRSQSEYGISFSFARRAALRISSPGAVPEESPIRFWKDARAMLATRRNALFSLMTFLMSMLDQELSCSLFFIRPASSSRQIWSGSSLSMARATSSTLCAETWAVPTRKISLPSSRVRRMRVSLNLMSCSQLYWMDNRNEMTCSVSLGNFGSMDTLWYLGRLALAFAAGS